MGTDLGVHAVQPRPQHRAAGVPSVRTGGVEQQRGGRAFSGEARDEAAVREDGRADG
ncbi:MAG: hypothetical protein M3R63_20740 [Actinomycetota bacterium]|nr:hypothetical protein [Actinomycetota bacterium]